MFDIQSTKSKPFSAATTTSLSTDTPTLTTRAQAQTTSHQTILQFIKVAPIEPPLVLPSPVHSAFYYHTRSW